MCAPAHRDDSRIHPVLGARSLTLALFFALATSSCSNEVEREGDGAQPPDVIILLIDTLRADALSIYDERLPIGDSIAGLAADGVVLEELRAPSSWTRSSVASLLTGKSISGHRVFGRLDVLGDRHETLAAVLASREYHTRAWSTNPNILPLWGFARGFDVFHDLTRAQTATGPMQGADVIDAVIEDLRSNAERPVFAYVHVTDPHNPYRPDADDLASVQAIGSAVAESFPGDLGDERARRALADDYPSYLGEVIDVDRAVGRLIAFLRESGRYDETLILLVSDHGEEFTDHGAIGHGRTLYEEVLRVPGVLKLPGGLHAGSRVATPAELADLMPTLLAAIGIESAGATGQRDVLSGLGPDGDVAGRSAEHDTTPSFYALTLDSKRLSGVRLGRHKLVYDHRRNEARLFDLVDDPGERRDLSRERPDVARRLKHLLDATQAVHEPGWHVRACGCRTPGRLELRVEAVEAQPVTSGFESDDHLRFDEPNARLRVEASLTPRTAVDAQGNPDPRSLRGDEDELVLRDGAGLSISHPRGEPLLVAAGNGAIGERRSTLVLRTLARRASVDPSEPVVCDPSGADFWKRGRQDGGCRAHWRIWWAPENESLDSEDVDPEVRARLRALGYAW